MDPVTVPELTTALVRAGDQGTDGTAWQALAQLVRAWAGGAATGTGAGAVTGPAASATGPATGRPVTGPAAFAGGPDIAPDAASDTAAPPPGPVAALDAAERSPGDRERAGALAAALIRHAATRPRLRRELALWARPAAPRDTGRTAAAGNVLQGAARVAGPVVQARDIHGDVHLHAPPPPVADRPVPRQLLPVPRHFTDREDELAALESLREDAARAAEGAPLRVVISGPAGIGKTALTSRWLRRAAGEFPDGQLYADLRGHSAADGPARPGDVLGQFLRALGVRHLPAELDEQTALWRSTTADLRIAVMLDNALSAAQVRPLLPASPASLVAVTSRRRLSGLVVDGAAFQQLGALAQQAAVDLLTRQVGVQRVRREPEAARRVAALCAGLPLAVSVAAARLAARPRQPLAVMAGALGPDGPGRLANLSAEGEQAVRTALDESYRGLPPEAARGYRRLGVLPVPVFDGAVVAAACAVSRTAAERVLDELVEVHLVEDLSPDPEDGTERYRFHDLVRAHAADLAGREDTPADRRDTVRRVVERYLATATEAERLLTPGHRTLRRDYAFPPEEGFPFTDSRSALNWLDRERLHLMAVLRTAVECEWHATAWQLVDAMWPLFLRLRPYDLWTEAHFLGLRAAERDGDPAAESRMLTSGGAGLRNAGRHDEAVEWFGRALAGARRDGDRRAESQALHGIGQSRRLAGRLEEAASHFTRALAIRESIGYRRGAALTRLCLGDTALADGRAAEAVPLLTEARSQLLAVDDLYDAARALALLARAHTRAHADPGTAERLLRQALGEFRATGSVHWQARTLEFLGETAEEAGDPTRAAGSYEESLALYAPVSPEDAGRLRGRLRGLDPAGPGGR
ncbi:tetratricopeptide repeat protein [Streptomyces sp. Ru87]|uniref:ATP-binding protein n=1 Tax=Streptomyces sp. Ru87 TaxID=2044307 RepID=UPI000BF8352D|nr:tetratricopeptide repeat protein [Streptomyces sp. Ru87]PGH51988.1 hypothetical protein CRI70_03800 [Streptomyces sp. Ru87]